MDKYCGADAVELVPGGADYFTVLEKLVDSAKEIVHLQTYIFDGDDTGVKVIEALKRAASRGVRIFVLVDGFGSTALPGKMVEDMKSMGIRFRYFSPFLTSESIFLGRRLHHKIVVADKEAALIGGINIANKYHGTEKELPWLDYALLIKGAICSYLDILCEAVFFKRNFWHVKGYTCPAVNKEIQVRFRRNDFVRRRNEIHRSFIEAIKNAKKDIVIAVSYFHPEPSLKLKIKQACKRGVKVRLLLAGESDFAFSKYGEQYRYSSLLRCGVEIYEWPLSVLHSKAIAVDDEWVSIGSYNLNELSHYLCIELNTDVKSKKLNSDFRKNLEQYLIPEYKVDKEKYINQNVLKRARNFVVYWCFYFIMKLFLPRRNKR